MLLGLVLLAVTLIITVAAVHDSQVRRKGRRILSVEQPASSPVPAKGYLFHQPAFSYRPGSKGSPNVNFARVRRRMSCSEPA